MDRAIQDQIAGNHCWGCGPLNPQGLQIKSYWQGDGAVCTFRPRPEHMAGPTGIVNGGIIATIIDSHSVCTAMAALAVAGGVDLADAPDLWAATASLHVDYLSPTPIDQTLHLTSRVLSIEGKRVRVECVLRAGDVDCARAEVLAVRVSPKWRESAPGAH